MTPLGLLLSAALVLITIFAVANWSLLTAPAALNFLFFSLEGPFGLILFGAIVVFAALFAIYAMSLRTTALLETRRHLRDLEAQRQIADNSEASRLAALAAQMEQEFAAMRAALAAVERSLSKRLEETTNAVFANVGQLDDKLDRLASRP